MTAYIIFVIILTAIYILYYAVTIYIDISHKPGAVYSGEEVFEIEQEDDTSSVMVEENPEGFSVGDSHYEAPVEITRNENNSANEEKAPKISVAEKFKESANVNMDDTDQFWTCTLHEADYKQELLHTDDASNGIGVKREGVIETL